MPSSCTSEPSRTTVSVTGSPPLARIAAARSSGSARFPSTATIRSPGARPIAAAGDPGWTSSTDRETSDGTPSMKTIARATMAKTKFVAGPARMTAMRLEVGARQYASPRQRVLDVVEPALGRTARRVRQLGRGRGLPERGHRRGRVVQAALRQRLLDGRRGLRDRGALVACRIEVGVEIARRGPVHPRDLHVAAERDRADAVLDPVPLPLHERGREEDVEAPRAHVHRQRGDEVAGLVDEDQEGQACDGDDEMHVLLSEPARG